MTLTMRTLMEERKREALVEMLKNQSVVVHFTKLNGDKRVMTCTLQEDMLPPAKKDQPLTQKKIRAINKEVMTVWDTNAKDWRAFRLDRIEKIENYTNQHIQVLDEDDGYHD